MKQNQEPKQEPKQLTWKKLILIILFLPFYLLYHATKFFLNKPWSPIKKYGSIAALWFFSAVIGFSYIGSQGSTVNSINITPSLTPTMVPAELIPTDIPTPTATPEPTVIITSTPTPTPTTTPQKIFIAPTKIPVQKPVYFAPTIPPVQNYVAPIQSINTNSSDRSTSTGGSGGSTSTNSSGGFSCNCSLTCTEITSCAEAQYQLNTCGCNARDADHDGIACDGAPLKCQN